MQRPALPVPPALPDLADVADSAQSMAEVVVPAYTKSGDAATKAAKKTKAAAQAVTFRERIMAGPLQVVSMRRFRAAECDGPARPL